MADRAWNWNVSISTFILALFFSATTVGALKFYLPGGYEVWAVWIENSMKMYLYMILEIFEAIRMPIDGESDNVRNGLFISADGFSMSVFSGFYLLLLRKYSVLVGFRFK